MGRIASKAKKELLKRLIQAKAGGVKLYQQRGCDGK
jgi:hypothetical protein